MSSMVESPVWSDHARKQWRKPERNDVPGQDYAEAWRQSAAVEYPSARENAWGRYHPEGDAVLICRWDEAGGKSRPVVVTVIDLTDRPLWEQTYVRCQVEYGGGGDA